MQFEAIRALVEIDLNATDRLIADAIHSDISLINELSQHIIQSGGKRMRPLLVLLSAKAFGYHQGNTHQQLAAIIELIHTATLLHDDVIDASYLRRGKQTANAIWDNKASVLVGDYIYSRAFQLMAQINNATVIDRLAKATNVIVEGEVLQLINCGDPDTTEERYLDVIFRKTGILFEVAAQLGATVANQPTTIIENIGKYGLHLGTAFQLIDDMLDYSGSSEEIGKNRGDDLAEGKPTLPLIHALKHAPASQQQQIRQAIQQRSNEHLDIILQAIESTNAIEYTYQAAKKQAELAISYLAGVPTSNYHIALHALAEFAINRSH